MDARKEMANKIISNPHNFKICEGCDSIVDISVDTCPNCHAYRFNSSEEAVVQQAETLGSREKTSVTSEDLT